MMKGIIYIGIVGALLLLGGCHDITVGYLFTEDAGYEVDTLEIFSITGRLEKIKGELEAFYKNFPDLQAQRESLKAEQEEKQQTANEFMKKKVDPLYDEVIKLEAQDDPELQDRIDELNDEIMQMEEEWFALVDEADQVGYALSDLENEIIEMGGETTGLSDAPGILEEEKDKLQIRIDHDVPFATAPISSVEGTEPLVYEIEGVRAATPEAAAAFRKSLDVMGGGVIYVKWDVVAPAGNYTVSLRISNEGRSKVVSDAFTFVMTE